MAFHPQYKSNRKFYVYYSAETKDEQANHESVVAEFTASASNPNVADAASERVLLTIRQPEVNHNGGCLAFGPDGMLYIASGDGGGSGDKHGEIGSGQDLSTVLGKILRIDIDKKSAGRAYAIPADNPFIKKSGARPEIYAYGLRNPWKFSFDRKTGKLFCADVGQERFEEINIIEKGKNYGWRIMEGDQCFNPPENCNRAGLTPPIHVYGRDVGRCIIGGYVYRGKQVPALVGKYIFADWKGKLYYLEEYKGGWRRGQIKIKNIDPFTPDFNSFGQDSLGELYVVTQGKTGMATGQTGIVYRFIP